MLVLIPLIYIGRYYYLLAKKYEHNSWGYGFLGAGITFLSQLLTGILAFVYAMLSGDETVYQKASIISLIAVGVSLIVATVVYKQLEKRWKRKQSSYMDNNQLLDH
jgi:Na+/phosphate symporter